METTPYTNTMLSPLRFSSAPKMSNSGALILFVQLVPKGWVVNPRYIASRQRDLMIWSLPNNTFHPL